MTKEPAKTPAVRRSRRRVGQALLSRLGTRSAKALLAAGRTGGGVTRIGGALSWEALRRLDSEQENRRRSGTALAQVLLTTRDLPGAHRTRLLEAVGKAELCGARKVPPSEYGRMVRSRLNEREIDAASVLIEAGLSDYPNNVALHDHRIAVADYRGNADEALAGALDNARRHIAALTSKIEDRDGGATVAVGQQGRLCLAGYFYSGSGAVVDYLRGFQDVELWTPASEMLLVRHPGGLEDLGDRFAAQGKFTPQDLVDFYHHNVGTRIPRDIGSFDRWKMVSKANARLRSKDVAHGYFRECLTYFLRLAELSQGGDAAGVDIEADFRGFVERAVAAAAADMGASRLILDQVAVAAKLDLARYLPPSSFVIVHRDPRDQYCEAREAWQRRGSNSSIEFFVGNYRERRAHVAGAIPDLEERCGHRFLHVSFEDFVVDHDKESQRILDFVGLEAAQMVEQRFFPEQSRANVGKYRGILTEDEARQLADALPEYLSDHAETPAV